jgi:hypothetical protein
MRDFVAAGHVRDAWKFDALVSMRRPNRNNDDGALRKWRIARRPRSCVPIEVISLKKQLFRNL